MASTARTNNWLLSWWNALKSFPTRLIAKQRSTMKNEFDWNKETEVQCDMTFTKVALQLRPLIILLQILGGYPIAVKLNNSNSDFSVVSRYVKRYHHKDSNSHVVDGGGVQILLMEPVAGSSNNSENVTSFAVVEIEPAISDNIYENTTLNFGRKITLCTFALKTLIVGAMVIFVLNLGLDIPLPIKMYSYTASYTESEPIEFKKYFKSAAINVPILRIVEMITIQLNVGLLVSWLNNWSNFEREFCNCFQKEQISFEFNIQKFRNVVLLLYFTISSIIWLSGTFFLQSSIVVMNVPYFSQFCIQCTVFFIWSYPLLEDCKIFVILKSTVLVLQQVRNGIRERGNSSDINQLDVICWRNLISTIRKQTALASSYLKSQVIILIVHTMLSCAVGVSLLLKFDSRDPNYDFKASFSTFYYCVMCFGRLYLKSILADKIPAEEHLIAEDVLAIDAKCDDGMSKTELKFLYNMLTQNTVVVSLGNYFALDKKLLLQVCASIVSYLIVILQFEGSNSVVDKVYKYK